MLLDTPTTRRWDDREKADVDAIERRTIFRKFSTRDDGKSRVFIKRCDTINQAIDECRRHNEIVDKMYRLNRILMKYCNK